MNSIQKIFLRRSYCPRPCALNWECADEQGVAQAFKELLVVPQISSIHKQVFQYHAETPRVRCAPATVGGGGRLQAVFMDEGAL